VGVVQQSDEALRLGLAMSDSQQWRKPKVQFEDSKNSQDPPTAVAGGRAQQFAGIRKSLLKKNAPHNKSAPSIRQTGASSLQAPRQRRISLPDSTTAAKAQQQATQPPGYDQVNFN
jgi:hypothetical protein